MNKTKVHGVGVNDSTGRITWSEGGKRSTCPYYARWQNMLKRCYITHLSKDKSYNDCSVCDEWLLFSNFKAWMLDQDWVGKCLDKDILKQGNKIYSPDHCLFVDVKINNLLNGRCNQRGKYLRGVHFNKDKNKYYSLCNKDKKPKNLGYFDTEDQAFEAYKKFKYKVIADTAKKQDEPLRSALLAYIIDKE